MRAAAPAMGDEDSDGLLQNIFDRMASIEGESKEDRLRKLALGGGSETTIEDCKGQSCDGDEENATEDGSGVEDGEEETDTHDEEGNGGGGQSDDFEHEGGDEDDEDDAESEESEESEDESEDEDEYSSDSSSESDEDDSNASSSSVEDSEDSDDESVRVKLCCRETGEIRAALLSRSANIRGFRRKLGREYAGGRDYSVSYTDEEGDLVTVRSTMDLRIALKEQYRREVRAERSGERAAALRLLLDPSSSRSGEKGPPSRRKSRAAPSKKGHVSKWQKGEVLGSGSFGTVYKALSLATGDTFAVKEVKLPKRRRRRSSGGGRENGRLMRAVQQLEGEISLLSGLSHPHIVRFLGTERTAKNLYILLEFCSEGSVGALIKQFGGFSEAIARRYTQQIIFGLAYLHGEGIMHRDLKPSNILLDKGGVVKLADFGCSKRLGLPTPRRRPGTPAAPVELQSDLSDGGAGGRDMGGAGGGGDAGGGDGGVDGAGDGAGGGHDYSNDFEEDGGTAPPLPSRRDFGSFSPWAASAGRAAESPTGAEPELPIESLCGAKTTVGTIIYMAPEVLACETDGGAAHGASAVYGRRADVWSLGATVVEMIAGKAPFPSAAVAVYRVGVQRGHPEVPRQLSGDGEDFLRRCFMEDPSQRPTAEALRLHPFCTEMPREGVDDPILFTATNANAGGNEAFEIETLDTPPASAMPVAWGAEAPPPGPATARRGSTRRAAEGSSDAKGEASGSFGESFLNSTI